MSNIKIDRLFAISLIVVVVFFGKTTFSQSDDWYKELSKDKKIEVQYHVGHRIDGQGDRAQLLEYVAITTTNVTLEKCIKTMRDVSLHKVFMGDTEESKELETYSENEWIAYYFFEPPWPMPDNDCVMKVTMDISDNGKICSFNGESIPGLIEKKDAKRLGYYEYKYVFEELENNLVEFYISVKLTPVGSAPNWMVRKWFPKGPIEFMEKFINLTREKK